MKILFLLMIDILLAGCTNPTKIFMVENITDFHRDERDIHFNVKFSGLNETEVEEFSQYEAGVFHCTNTLKSGQIVTGFSDKINKKDLTAKSHLFSCKKNPADNCYDSQYDVDMPHNVEIKCYITYNSMLKKTYQTEEFKILIP